MKRDIEHTSPEISRGGFLKGAALLVGGLALEGCTPTQKPEEKVNPNPEAPVAPEPDESHTEGSMEFATEPSWSQEFKDMTETTVDTSVWRHEDNYDVPTWNENELQGYTPDNVRIEPGYGLVIEAKRQSFTYETDPEEIEYDFTSGRIDTQDSFNFEYGKFEVSMKMPKGDGAWPAFWFLSKSQPHTEGATDADYAKPGFYKHNGEPDAMEYYSTNRGVIEATMHTYSSHANENPPTSELFVPDADEKFHTYGVEFTPTSMTCSVDGEVFFRFDKPSDDPDDWPFGNGNTFYPILNLAMGGPAGEPQSDQDSWQFAVEYMRFYEYTGTK